jgi:hypothetical protein
MRCCVTTGWRSFYQIRPGGAGLRGRSYSLGEALKPPGSGSSWSAFRERPSFVDQLGPSGLVAVADQDPFAEGSARRGERLARAGLGELIDAVLGELDDKVSGAVSQEAKNAPETRRQGKPIIVPVATSLRARVAALTSQKKSAGWSVTLASLHDSFLAGVRLNLQQVAGGGGWLNANIYGNFFPLITLLLITPNVPHAQQRHWPSSGRCGWSPADFSLRTGSGGATAGPGGSGQAR